MNLKLLGERLGYILVRLDRVRHQFDGDEEVFLTHDEVGRVEGGEFESVTVGDGVSWAGLDTVAAEDAAVVVDVVDLGVALCGGDACLFRVFRGLNVDAVRGAGSGAEETGDALFEAVLITLQLVLAAEALLKLGATHGSFAVGVVFDFGWLEHLLKGDAHSLGNGSGVANDRHSLSIRRGGDRLEVMSRPNLFTKCIFTACFMMMGAVTALCQTAETTMGAMAEHSHAATPASTSLSLVIDGRVTTLSVAELQSFPQKSVTVHNEHMKMDETYSGVLLGDLLAKYGLPVDKSTHRKMLRSYLVAEGMDQYRVVMSVTEVEGTEHNGDVIVATMVGGKPLGDDGELKLIISGDKKPERWVRNLMSITVKSLE